MAKTGIVAQLNLIPDDIPERIKVWVAAAIEYDGNIGVQKNSRYHTYQARVRISSINRELVDSEDFRIFGGHLRLEARSRCKPIWRRDYYGKEVIRLLRTIRPYLRTKSRQADIVLSLAERHQLTRVQTTKYKEMYEEVKRLNEEKSGS